MAYSLQGANNPLLVILNNCSWMWWKMYTTLTDTDVNNCLSLDHTLMKHEFNYFSQHTEKWPVKNKTKKKKRYQVTKILHKNSDLVLIILFA